MTACEYIILEDFSSLPPVFTYRLVNVRINKTQKNSLNIYLNVLGGSANSILKRFFLNSCWEGYENILKWMFFSYWHYLGYEPKFKPLRPHLSFETSSLCIIGLSYFPIQVYVTIYSGFLSIQWFVLKLAHLSTLAKAHLWHLLTARAKAKDRNLPLHILSTSCQFILGKYKLLSVGTNRLAAFKSLSWFGFENPLGCEPSEGLKYFVTKPCSPLMDMEENSPGYLILTCPKHSGGHGRLIFSP